MAREWTLGEITLPNPKSYTPIQVVNDSYNLTLGNRLTRQIRGRKTTHKLLFNALTVSEFNAIRALVDENAVKSFSAVDGDLVISARDVHCEILDRGFPYKGAEFRSDITLELKEVD